MLDADDRLRRLADVNRRDDRWRIFGDRSLEQHHKLISIYELYEFVPDSVVQHYENARNAWLYSFFSYRLLQVAITQLHIAAEVALKERASLEIPQVKTKNLEKLLVVAIERRWLLDARFTNYSDRWSHELEEQRVEELKAQGIDATIFVGPIHEQMYALRLVDSYRHIRNSLAHGEVILKHNLSVEFEVIRDLINQLFTTPS